MASLPWSGPYSLEPSDQYYDQAPWRGPGTGWRLSDEPGYPAPTSALDDGRRCGRSHGCHVHSASILHRRGKTCLWPSSAFAGGACATLECTTRCLSAQSGRTLYLLRRKGTVKAGGISDNIIEHWAFADGWTTRNGPKPLIWRKPAGYLRIWTYPALCGSAGGHPHTSGPVWWTAGQAARPWNSSGHLSVGLPPASL